MAFDLVDILAVDLADPMQYISKMVSLSPKGIVPMVLGLERDKIYNNLVEGFQARCELVRQGRKLWAPRRYV